MRRNKKLDNKTYELGEIVVSREQIQEMVCRLAERINRDYAGKELIVVGVLRGAMVFLADLIRELTIPLKLDFIIVSSYGVETSSSGVVLMVKDIDFDIEGKHVLIVEDLIDTGLTLNYLKKLFLTRNPASLKISAAFDKPSRRSVEIDVDYSGISLEDKFIVGYGLDYAHLYRNLPEVRVMIEKR